MEISPPTRRSRGELGRRVLAADLHREGHTEGRTQGRAELGRVQGACSLADRLAKRAASIEQASNLRVEDFLVRFLVVDGIWIPLGENILIETFKPLWNRAIDGFGNRDTGMRRATQ
ncbi:Eco29kI family restriction endonuclease [Sinorhizobium medicae]|nr:Eco29kI family restriction endonuclease [Sinorhizobium medicae]MDX0872482.1 Eco29kI family restriction endonuclease [Sinorhizobium medicae]